VKISKGQGSTNLIIIRLFLSIVIAVILGGLYSEVVYRINEGQTRQNPERFDLVVPAGTAKRIQAGESVPSIPANMVFIVGDILLVHNKDDVPHQLGPIWVPPGATGSLVLQEPNQYSYACTFQPTQYIGLDVRPRLTSWIRFQGILAIALPSAVLFWLYSLLIWPVRKQEEASL